MGAGVSAGENNNDLIDNLKQAKYIKTTSVERVFRAVDRATYFLPYPPVNAYRDVAYKNGNIHLSAPVIYCEVLEALQLKPGLSFLNLGSGTGYFSTMAGLILGTTGINHGIELFESNIEFANKKLEEFKKYSGAIDEYEFCEPKFIKGNCLCIASGHYLYDRVYCGASCPEQYVNYMKNLIKIGGILIIPCHEQLMEMKRTSESYWNMRSLLPVSYATLLPPENTNEMIKLFDVEPLLLQELCRMSIRNILRKNLEIEHPDVKQIMTEKTNKKKKKIRSRKLFIPSQINWDESSDDESSEEIKGNMKSTKEPLRKNLKKEPTIDIFTNSHNNIKIARLLDSSPMEIDSVDSSSSSTDDDGDQKRYTQKVRVVIEHRPSDCSDSKICDQNDEIIPDMKNVFVNLFKNVRDNSDNNQNIDKSDDENDYNNVNGKNGNCSKKLRKKQRYDQMSNSNIDKFSDHGSEVEDDDDENDGGDEEVDSDEDDDDNGEHENRVKNINDFIIATTSEGERNNVHRKKFDSGLGDEIVEANTPSNNMSDDDIIVTGSTEKEFNKWQNYLISSSDDECKTTAEIKMYNSPYSTYLKQKIQDLPLPSILKRYLNFHRDF